MEPHHLPSLFGLALAYIQLSKFDEAQQLLDYTTQKPWEAEQRKSSKSPIRLQLSGPFPQP